MRGAKAGVNDGPGVGYRSAAALETRRPATKQFHPDADRQTPEGINVIEAPKQQQQQQRPHFSNGMN